MATRSLIQLYRTINPELLARKDRGKTASMALSDGQMKVLKYGEVSVASGIAGSGILAKVEKAKVAKEEEEEEDGEEDGQEGLEGWEVASEDGEELEEIGSDVEGEEFEGEEEEDDDDDEEKEDDDEEEEIEEEEEGEEAQVEVTSKTTTEAKQDLPIEAMRILTDEDFKRIRRHRMKEEAERLSGKKRKRGDEDEDGENNEEDDESVMDLGSDSSDMDEDDEDEGQQEFIDPSALLAGVRRKSDYDDRMASIQSGREGRAKFGSKKGQRKAESGASMTNREKSKKTKNFIMIAHKRAVVGKKRRSLKDKSRALRAHIKKQKMKK
jgi:protein SDA1